MQFILVYSEYIFLFLLIISQVLGIPVSDQDSTWISDIGDALLSVDQTATLTSTPSDTVTPTETSLDTAIPTQITVTQSLTSTETNDTSETPQPTGSTTAQPTITRTSVPSITATPTPDYTDTPGPTDTLVPLPSITLLFPVDTATSIPSEVALDSSITPENSQVNAGSGSSERISAQAILLIGTIVMLWVILAIFIIFYIKRISE